MLKLFYAPTSPYVRKVMVSAALLGLTEQIDKLSSAAHPVNRDQRIADFSPLAKVPTAMTDSGQVLFDSRVICAYLDDVDGQHRLFPVTGEAQWTALTWQSVGDGLLDAALLARYETTARPQEVQWTGWIDAQMTKIHACLALIDASAATLSIDTPTIGEITLGCALGYLDFRFASLDWRAQYPSAATWFDAFNATPAMAATIPFDVK
jgi:glutathione S-transferase